VLVEHRGHRLGGLVEAAVLRQVARALPQVRTITTSTAETTTPMVAVDEALGSCRPAPCRPGPLASDGSARRAPPAVAA
jgi:hypothetical protein